MVGDFNIDVNLPSQEHEKLEEFCNLFILSNLIKSDTCFAKTHTYKHRRDVFCKKGALGNFAKFTGKHLYQRLFLNIVAKAFKGQKLQALTKFQKKTG